MESAKHASQIWRERTSDDVGFVLFCFVMGEFRIKFQICFNNKVRPVVVIFNITANMKHVWLYPHHFGLYIQVEDECGEIPMVIVQNKIDLVNQAVVDA